MKKRVFLPLLAVICIVFAGCGKTEEEKVLQVVEIPIEETFEKTESTVNTEQIGRASCRERVFLDV